MILAGISWPTFFPSEADTINALFAAGLTLLHLRKPGAAAADVAELVGRIEPRFRDRLTLHYLPGLAAELGLGGYHLSDGHPPAPARWGGRLSASCHSLDEVRRAKALGLDYVFLSPIFDSVSKRGYTSAFTAADVARAAAEGVVDSRVVALGGVTPSNLRDVAAMGFGGAAVLGSLWATDNGSIDNVQLTIDNFRALQEAIAQLTIDNCQSTNSAPRCSPRRPPSCSRRRGGAAGPASASCRR